MRHRTIAVVTFTAALALAGSQTGCDKNRSPTAPPPPQPQPQPQVVVARATFSLEIRPANASRNHPLSGEVQVDGQSLWSGTIPQTYCYANGYCETSSVGPLGRSGTLNAGPHTLRFRVTDQQRSPTGYYVSGSVLLTWSNGRGENVASWQDVPVHLRTGEEWSTEFTVPAGPPS
jgi:hypothetical protein